MKYATTQYLIFHASLNFYVIGMYDVTGMYGKLVDLQRLVSDTKLMACISETTRHMQFVKEHVQETLF